ncbi:arylesterase [Novosphingobium sp. Chol11]|uniref:arylesterase n=1 Tax=Novosphingobium sp. Chol11 TaxID=1385763 RepID=UPI0025CCFB67|nr:arylesterase [Novosphingobium sp. Chol11]
MRQLVVLLAFALGACSAQPAPLASESAAAASIPVLANAPVILAFGDSLYAGYQLDPGLGYPPRLEAALNQAGVPARLVNAGVSGDTTAAARARLAFTLDNQPVKPALVMVGLGGNDMLRGLAVAETRANLDAILTELDRRQIPAMLTGMLAAPNMGADYAKAFNGIYPDLAKKHHAALVPFFLSAVIGRDALMLEDRIHPNAQGIEKIVAATQAEVAKALKAAQR